MSDIARRTTNDYRHKDKTTLTPGEYIPPKLPKTFPEQKPDIIRKTRKKAFPCLRQPQTQQFTSFNVRDVKLQGVSLSNLFGSRYYCESSRKGYYRVAYLIT